MTEANDTKLVRTRLNEDQETSAKAIEEINAKAPALTTDERISLHRSETKETVS